MNERNNKYLNVVLTVNAVLMAAVVFTLWSDAAPFAQSAEAQSTFANRTRETPGQRQPGVGIPNSAMQRQKMVESLAAMEESLNALKAELETGRLQVEVTNLDELK